VPLSLNSLRLTGIACQTSSMKASLIQKTFRFTPSFLPVRMRPRLAVVVPWLVSGLVAVLVNCQRAQPLFSKLDPAETGIQFVNDVHDSDSLNILDYIYFYNGGGVAAGDVNNDGLVDLYFSANQGANKLYLNKGACRFEDITEQTQLRGRGNWKTGVTMADVNGDGRLDIYLCVVGHYQTLTGRNQLFINTGNDAAGIPRFTEQAHAYGLDCEGFNTQATFFDYDRDGDLDAFLVNHSIHSTASYGKADSRQIPDEFSGDKLLRNDSLPTGRHFTDVSRQAGIYSSSIGYGLNVVAGDLNNDGWDDLYVSNDFHENDYYYLNQGNGTFMERNQQAFGHESRFSMGSDIGDVNNDGWLDIISLDMLPADEAVLKTSAGEDPLDIYQYKLDFGYHHQYARNCLQLNVGGGHAFSDIALLAGVSATDWSWSPLLADFDNDGVQDLFMTNGIQRRPNNMDYIRYTADGYMAVALQTKSSLDQQAIRHMPSGAVHHYLFQGTDSLRFVDRSADWGFGDPTLANGSVSVDLDNDGDLDLVTNVVNGPAGIYRNEAQAKPQNRFIKVQLVGVGANRFGVGAKVVLKHGGRLQLNYQTPTRGFESGSLTAIHFGVGTAETLDTLAVIWPDQQVSLLTNVPTNRQVMVRQQDANQSASFLRSNPVLPTTDNGLPSHPLVTERSPLVSPLFRHRENGFNDFGDQPLLPCQLSTQGPKLAVADIDGDGLDDFYVCGAKGQPGGLYRQTRSGSFVATDEAVFARDTLKEEVNALFFDANGDKAPDLYLVCGGNEQPVHSASLTDRLYLNDGHGHFKPSRSLPLLQGSKAVATAADLDHDGDLDLFVGGRVVTGQYGVVPTSYLLLNDGKGRFTQAASRLAPGLDRVGMVTDAAWTDLNKDGWDDLVVVGEWMPVTVFQNKNGKLTLQTRNWGLGATSGLWQSLHVADVDHDGDPDVLAGNWGENTKFRASPAAPMQLYVADLDHNGQLEQILAQATDGVYYPFAGKEELEKQMPGLIRKQYLTYQSFARQPVASIFKESLEKAARLTVNTLSSVLLRNDGQGTLRMERLPGSTQYAPVYSFLTDDLNQDGRLDVLAGGNFYGVTPYQGRYDASHGSLLLQTPNGAFVSLLPARSGFAVSGEVRSIKALNTHGGTKIYVIARNNTNLLFYGLAPKTTNTTTL